LPGENIFLTAGHVVEDARNVGEVVIVERQLSDKSAVYRQLQIENREIEIWPEIDLAILKTKNPPLWTSSLNWLMRENTMLEELISIGYPYSYEPDKSSLPFRSFSGHVVTVQNFDKLTSHPKCFELSFNCPRGLSGAPVMTGYKGNWLVRGLVIGNRRIDMPIFRDGERIEEKNEVTIIERYDSLSLGIALTADVILEQYSKLVGCTIGELLKDSGKLTP